MDKENSFIIWNEIYVKKSRYDPDAMSIPPRQEEECYKEVYLRFLKSNSNNN